MQLSVLLQNVLPISAEIDREITGLALDSRQIKQGYLFLAYQGTAWDGRQYIQNAIENGARVVLQEKPNQSAGTEWHNDIPILSVEKLRDKLGAIAAQFNQEPTKKLCIIGVTGTNGKTSCSHFIAHALQNLHKPCGIIGTLGSGFYGALQQGQLTTPDVLHLYSSLRNFVDLGAEAVAMEVSSHGIDQGRIQNIPFEIGIFTNLTRDHLDYHGDIETYAAVKKSFLASPLTQRVIVNADDAYGQTWLSDLAATKPVLAYSVRKPKKLPTNVLSVYAEDIEFHDDGIKATLYSPWGKDQLSLPLIGEFNLSNALAVFSALCWLDFPHTQVLEQIAQLEPVPGRMQVFGGGSKPTIVVDYSHTPDALEKVLQTIKAHCTGKLWCLFGCGGDRDRGKRPQMAHIAEQLAHEVIVTNDNPRHEKPEAIAEDILRGFSHPKSVKVQLDRSKAIQDIIQCAAKDDWILIAGKGAETYQQFGDEKFPFSDIQEVGKWINLN